MKVTLKKAAALSAALLATKVSIDHSYNVDVYAVPPTQETIDNLAEKLKVQVENAQVLVATGYTIRNMIGQANVGRINELLTARAMVEKQLSIINSIPIRENGTNLDALHAKIAVLKDGNDKVGLAFRGNPSLELETSSIVTPILRDLRKRKRNIDEELQTLNFTTTIELPDDVVKVLTGLDLI